MPTTGGGQRRLLFTGNVKTNLVNKYTSGSGVGAVSTSSRRALKRRATSSAGTLDSKGNLIPGKPCCSSNIGDNLEPIPEPVPEPVLEAEPESEGDRLADFEVQLDKSRIDENTGVITFVVKNIGGEDSTGYEDWDYRRVIEVTTNKAEAKQIYNLSASAKFHVKQSDNTFVTYYQKSTDDYDLKLIIPESDKEKGEYKTSYYTTELYYENNDNEDLYLLYAGQGSANDRQYLENFPPLKSQESISYHFTGEFKIGNTYMVSADDPFWNDDENSFTGDTIEIIDDDNVLSNNYFVFTYNNKSKTQFSE